VGVLALLRQQDVLGTAEDQRELVQDWKLHPLVVQHCHGCHCWQNVEAVGWMT
jgi:hypothetical protein